MSAADSPEAQGIQTLIYTRRRELLSVAADGSVWACDNRSLEGYSRVSAASTLVRRYAVPAEVEYAGPGGHRRASTSDLASAGAQRRTADEAAAGAAHAAAVEHAAEAAGLAALHREEERQWHVFAAPVRHDALGGHAASPHHGGGGGGDDAAAAAHRRLSGDGGDAHVHAVRPAQRSVGRHLCEEDAQHLPTLSK